MICGAELKRQLKKTPNLKAAKEQLKKTPILNRAKEEQI